MNGQIGKDGFLVDNNGIALVVLRGEWDKE
jgi:hypothetical protein